jgi:hypothetical protein
MASVLGWDRDTVDAELAHYRGRLEAEAAAQALLSDADSDSARAHARDPRLEELDRRVANS